MKAISFELSGKTACFRKPDVNQYAYFTYNNIHKPALLGMLGAILGYGGYTQLFNQKKRVEEQIKGVKGKAKEPLQNQLKELDKKFPEFYEKLKHLKVSITPLSPHGYFSKKIQVFNNSVGYANGMVGGTSEKALKERRDSSNLVVHEQWLENPKWQIMILDDGSKEYEKIKEHLSTKKSVFIPYLGKNDHPATIDDTVEVELKTMLKDIKCSSLFIENKCEISTEKPRGEFSSWFKEISPTRLKEKYHFYEYENLIFTNHKIVSSKNSNIYSFDNKNYFFL